MLSMVPHCNPRCRTQRSSPTVQIPSLQVFFSGDMSRSLVITHSTSEVLYGSRQAFPLEAENGFIPKFSSVADTHLITDCPSSRCLVALKGKITVVNPASQRCGRSRELWLGWIPPVTDVTANGVSRSPSPKNAARVHHREPSEC